MLGVKDGRWSSSTAVRFRPVLKNQAHHHSYQSLMIVMRMTTTWAAASIAFGIRTVRVGCIVTCSAVVEIAEVRPLWK